MSKQKSAKSVVAVQHETAAKQFSKARTLAARIGLHPKTLFRWADAGLIHRHKVNGRVVLFEDSEVFAVIAASRVSNSGSAA